MRIGIVGGGVAGLGSAYFLSRRDDHHIEIFEQAAELGGLAGCFDFDGMAVEKYYHFICRGDSDLIDVIDRLGLNGELEWRPGTMKFFYRGNVFPFSTPWDLVRFRPLSLPERLRFGLNVVLSRSGKSWEQYESITAREWLISQLGAATYEVIWEPLLRIKFGPYYDQVSASWIWHRIHRVARSRSNWLARERLGFLKGGTQVLLDRLVQELHERGVHLHTSATVEGINVGRKGVTALTVAGELRPFDCLISTVPLPVLTRLLPAGEAPRLGDINRIEYISVVCVIMKLQQPVTDAFWININDPAVPFNGFIEYTNLNPRADADSPHLLYVPFYLPPEHPRLTESDAKIFEDCVAGLRVVRRDFSPRWVSGYRVFRDRYAQAICTKNFSQRVPPVRSRIPGLFVTDSTQLYPSDRTISGMLGQARQVATLLVNP